MSLESRIKLVLLGAHHPHFYVRVDILQTRGDVDIIGFWEEDVKLADKISRRLDVKLFSSEHDLLQQPFDIAFVHSLDHDNPRLARLAAAAKAKALLLEKPGATHPQHIFELAGKFEAVPRPGCGVGVGDALC